MIRMLLVLVLLLLTLPVRAEPEVAAEAPKCSEGRFGPRHCIAPDSFVRDTCVQIEAEARLHGLPPGFLARLLWQESRFDPNAVSPMRAMGIAQFIASTARLRGLEDPFNPAEAIEKSAEYLGEMTRRYGNVGLAAIGYNGGERRVEGFVAGTGGLARETIDYVRIITGEHAETWRDTPPKGKTFSLDDDRPFLAACETMAANRRLSPLAAPEPRFAPWGVQVGYGTTRSAARASYDRLTGSCRSAAPVARLEFVPLDRRGPGRKTIIAARIGAQSRDEALRLCRAISRAGCICRAYRN
ncbi:lytic transglycosylase domain-containing protein [Jannaschia pohangensis]|uniref:Sporulation related domain-containing protein n=1 Tax=Jannaschia pohangensis TaxID=390807 RepID=A0A1I3UBX5_9RHOB|nr:lytic transglycosylase domain-containing protein [Jannaschia pohangensis]SFJ80405.1 Sporulation related domain-containing protein [Jannaschia pohangensis]